MSGGSGYGPLQNANLTTTTSPWGPSQGLGQQYINSVLSTIFPGTQPNTMQGLITPNQAAGMAGYTPANGSAAPQQGIQQGTNAAPQAPAGAAGGMPSAAQIAALRAQHPGQTGLGLANDYWAQQFPNAVGPNGHPAPPMNPAVKAAFGGNNPNESASRLASQEASWNQAYGNGMATPFSGPVSPPASQGTAQPYFAHQSTNHPAGTPAAANAANIPVPSSPWQNTAGSNFSPGLGGWLGSIAPSGIANSGQMGRKA